MLELARDSKSSFLHSLSSPDMTEGDKKRILFLTVFTLDFNSGGMTTYYFIFKFRYYKSIFNIYFKES